MVLSIKNKFFISLAFGIYLILVELFFGAEKFLGSRTNFILYSLLILFTSVFIEFAFIIMIEKLGIDKLFKRISFATSFLFSSLVTASILWIIFSGSEGHLLIYLITFLIASILPSLMSILLFIFEDAQTTISAVILQHNHDGNEMDLSSQTFVLENESGKQILKVGTEKLICFEANDNYVVTYYLDSEGHLKRSMDRFSLKKIDDILLASNIHFERVHKSYIVNPAYVDAIKGKAQSYKLQLRHFDALIPVSRSYNISLLQKY